MVSHPYLPLPILSARWLATHILLLHTRWMVSHPYSTIIYSVGQMVSYPYILLHILLAGWLATHTYYCLSCRPGGWLPILLLHILSAGWLATHTCYYLSCHAPSATHPTTTCPASRLVSCLHLSLLTPLAAPSATYSLAIIPYSIKVLHFHC